MNPADIEAAAAEGRVTVAKSSIGEDPSWIATSTPTSVADTPSEPPSSSAKGSPGRSSRKRTRRAGTAQEPSGTPPPTGTETPEGDPPPVAAGGNGYTDQAERQKAMDDAVAAWQASLRIPAPSIPSTDTPQRAMPTAQGRVVVLAGDGQVYWPTQPEPEPIEAPDEPQVFIPVPPGVVYLTAGARALAEGWKCPFPELEQVLRQRETFLVAIQRITDRAVEDRALISAAVRSCDVEATVEAMTANALHTWSIAERIHEKESDLVGFSLKLEVETEKLLWHNQRAVLRSLLGRNSAAVQVIRRRVERMAGTISPRAINAFPFYEYALHRRELPQ